MQKKCASKRTKSPIRECAKSGDIDVISWPKRLRMLFPQVSCIGRPTCSSLTHEVVVIEPGVVESLLNVRQFEASECRLWPAKIKMRLALVVTRSAIFARRKHSRAIV